MPFDRASLFFLIFDLYFLIPAAIAQIYNPIAEHVILIGIPIKEEKTKFEIHTVVIEAKIGKCSIYFRVAQTFLCFLLINSIHFALFLQKIISCFIYIFQSKFLTDVFFSHIFTVIIYFII